VSEKKEFFDEETNHPVEMQELLDAAHKMSEDELVLMAGLAKKLIRE